MPKEFGFGIEHDVSLGEYQGTRYLLGEPGRYLFLGQTAEASFPRAFLSTGAKKPIVMAQAQSDEIININSTVESIPLVSVTAGYVAGRWEGTNFRLSLMLPGSDTVFGAIGYALTNEGLIDKVIELMSEASGGKDVVEHAFQFAHREVWLERAPVMEHTIEDDSGNVVLRLIYDEGAAFINYGEFPLATLDFRVLPDHMAQTTELLAKPLGDDLGFASDLAYRLEDYWKIVGGSDDEG